MQKLMTRITLVPDGEPIFNEMGFHVEICDEAAGEFVVVSSNQEEYGSIPIEVGTWESLRDAIDEMVKACRG